LTGGRPAKRLPARSTDGAPEEDRVAEEKKEAWTQWVALTTTILAVCAAISSLKGGSYSTKVQLATTIESNKWSFYQSKSMKQNLAELERAQMEVAALEARTPEGKQAAAKARDRAAAEAKRYETEKAEIKAAAEGLQADEVENKRHGAAFGQAVMLLQIAITMSAVGALIKRPLMWYLGMACGAVGLFYMVSGFL
jgi:hypothetical protein